MNEIESRMLNMHWPEPLTQQLRQGLEPSLERHIFMQLSAGLREQLLRQLYQPCTNHITDKAENYE